MIKTKLMGNSRKISLEVNAESTLNISSKVFNDPLKYLLHLFCLFEKIL